MKVYPEGKLAEGGQVVFHFLAEVLFVCRQRVVSRIVRTEKTEFAGDPLAEKITLFAKHAGLVLGTVFAVFRRRN
jgi:hypothetical protein